MKQNILCPWWINENHIGKIIVNYIIKSYIRVIIYNISNILWPWCINRNHIYWQKHRQNWSKTFYFHDGSTEIIYIGKGIINILWPWWINRNCMYTQKQSKPFYDQQKLYTQAKLKQNILCPWWINGNITFIGKSTGKIEARHFMSMMDQ